MWREGSLCCNHRLTGLWVRFPVVTAGLSVGSPPVIYSKLAVGVNVSVNVSKADPAMTPPHLKTTGVYSSLTSVAKKRLNKKKINE